MHKRQKQTNKQTRLATSKSEIYDSLQLMKAIKSNKIQCIHLGAAVNGMRI